MTLYTFGSGSMFGVRTDIANATPVQFGTLQEASVEFNASAKELFGTYQFPVAVARGTAKIAGKAKAAAISGITFANLFFGKTSADVSTGALGAGQTPTIVGEAHTVPAVSTYTVTITPPSSGTFQTDLGVIYASTGVPFKRVASAPTTGQYSLTGAVYTFAAGDASAAVLVSYTYTLATGGQQFTISNSLLGVQPVFKVVLRTNWTGPNGLLECDLQLNACIASKLSVATKLEDWTIPEFEFSAFADNSNNIGVWSFSSVG